jgi:hypothetical protein
MVTELFKPTDKLLLGLRDRKFKSVAEESTDFSGGLGILWMDLATNGRGGLLSVTAFRIGFSVVLSFCI